MVIDINDIEKLEEEYFLDRSKKRIVMDVEIIPSLNFEGFSSSFNIDEEILEEKKEIKSVAIKSTTLNMDKGKPLL